MIWPYASSTSLAPASGVMRGSANVSAGIFTSSSAGSLNQFSRMPSFSNPSGASFSTTPSRPAYPSNCSSNFCDDMLDQYPLSTPQYLFPGQNSQALSPGYTGQNSQQWKPIPPHPVSRASLEFNQDSNLRYGGSAYSFMNSSSTSSVPNIVTDVSPAFPGLSSLEKSLPMHSVNRTLPNPASNKASIDSITNSSPGGTADYSTPFGVPQNLNYKSDLSWANEHVTTGGNQGPMNSVSLGASEGVSKPSSPPRLSQDSSSFGLIPMSNAPLALTTSHSSEYMPSILPESANSGDTHLGLGDSTFQAGLSNDTMLSNHGSTSLYSYSMGNSGRNGSFSDSLASEGTLANGQVYARLRQTDSQPVPSFDSLRKPSLETIATTHRAHVSSISARRY